MVSPQENLFFSLTQCKMMEKCSFFSPFFIFSYLYSPNYCNYCLIIRSKIIANIPTNNPITKTNLICTGLMLFQVFAMLKRFLNINKFPIDGVGKIVSIVQTSLLDKTIPSSKSRIRQLPLNSIHEKINDVISE